MNDKLFSEVLSNGEDVLGTPEVPEIPSFITLIYKAFKGAPWASFLHRWENIIFSIIIATIIAIVFYVGTRKRAMIPSGLQNFLEALVEAMQKLILGILGSEGKKYLPFLGTLFVYILTMNLFGLIPLMRSPSSNLSITAALAICVFCFVQYLNIKNMGILGFLYHLAGSPKNAVGWMMVPLMFPLELLTQLSRPVTLALRLCGNIMGEHILIGAFALLGISLLPTLAVPFGIPLQTPFIFLSILTGLMQALVFTMLATVYILLSIPHSEKKH